jgi:hypothetical protein
MPTCQGIKQDGKPCRYEANVRYDHLFCGIHKRQYHERRALQRETSQSLPIGLHHAEQPVGRSSLQPQTSHPTPDISKMREMISQEGLSGQVAIQSHPLGPERFEIEPPREVYDRSVRIVMEWFQHIEPPKKTELLTEQNVLPK